jgi:NAD+ synthase (glutamine-hydrolysing)
MSKIRVAMAQINVTVGDLAGNMRRMLDATRNAQEREAHIVTFPESALCGYPAEDLTLRPRFLEDNRKYIERFARECGDLVVIAGFVDSKEGRAYNAAALIHDRDVIAVYHKMELPNYGVFDEKRYFSHGRELVSFEMGGVRFALTICEDIWIPGGGPERWLAAHPVDVVLNISASPFHAGKFALRRDTVKRFARDTGALLFYNNLVGGQDELVFDGGSFVVDAEGRVRAEADRFEEALLVVDVDASECRSLRASRNFQEVCGGAVELKSTSTPTTTDDSGRMAKELSPVEEIYRALVLGTKDYVEKNGFQQVVLGLSGGIDSALTAAVAVEAFGAKNVLGVTMPSKYTSEATLSDARRLAENLGVRCIEVPISGILESYLDALAEPFGPGPGGVAEENLQARIRGNILMALSNRFGQLVLTTGNKSETAVGYCTLYGDMAGGFAVIKDVPKTTVYEVSNWLNRRVEGREIIPRSIVDRAPSAELRPGQKDEDSLPPYHILDPILRAYVEEDKAPDEIVASGYDAATVYEVVRLIHRNEYKRRQAAPGVKITPKAFGRDRRLPITNKYVGAPDEFATGTE